jgi:uncharacterized protein
MTDDRMRGDKCLCEVFKSPRREEMYLWVDRRFVWESAPESLLDRFARPVSLMTLVLTPEKTLGRARATDVMTAIRENGYYLQMPPAREDYLLDVYRTPTEARY